MKFIQNRFLLYLLVSLKKLLLSKKSFLYLIWDLTFCLWFVQKFDDLMISYISEQMHCP